MRTGTHPPAGRQRSAATPRPGSSGPGSWRRRCAAWGTAPWAPAYVGGECTFKTFGGQPRCQHDVCRPPTCQNTAGPEAAALRSSWVPPPAAHQQGLHLERVRRHPLVAAAVHGCAQQHAGGPLAVQADRGVVGALLVCGERRGSGLVRSQEKHGSGPLAGAAWCTQCPVEVQLGGRGKACQPQQQGQEQLSLGKEPSQAPPRASCRFPGSPWRTCECMHIRAASPRPPLGLASHRLSSPLEEDTSQPVVLVVRWG